MLTFLPVLLPVPTPLSLPEYMLCLHLLLHFNNKIIPYKCTYILFYNLLIYLAVYCKHIFVLFSVLYHLNRYILFDCMYRTYSTDLTLLPI